MKGCNQLASNFNEVITSTDLQSFDEISKNILSKFDMDHNYLNILLYDSNKNMFDIDNLDPQFKELATDVEKSYLYLTEQIPTCTDLQDKGLTDFCNKFNLIEE